MSEEEKERVLAIFMDFARTHINRNVELRDQDHLPMSWKIALVVAIITALITAALTAPVADHVTRKLKVSNFEGGRGMAIAFIFIPAGFIGGFLLGLLGTKLVHAVEWAQFWKAAGLSLAMGLGSMGAIAGLFLLSVPKPPLIDGELLELEAEILVPEHLQPKDSLSDRNPRVSLYAGDKDNRYVEVDFKKLRTGEKTLLIPLRAGLNTVSHTRMLSLTIDDSASYTLDMPLQPAPRREDLEWTPPMPMRLSNITGNGYTFTDVMVRYRVVKTGKPEKD